MAGKSRFTFRLFIFALVLFVSSSVAHAANNCPWLNEATASDFLGGNAVGTYISTTSPASCSFVQQTAKGTRSLVITVEVAPKPHERLMAVTRRCGADRQAVTGIGNEALRCMVKSHHRGAHLERIVGRVRDQIFFVTLSTTVKQDPALTPEELAMRIYSAAEQVSGNLF